MTALDDCFLHDRDRLRHDEALDLLREGVVTVTGNESLELSAAPGRILAEDIVAQQDVPLRSNAAVDGFAFANEGPERRAVSMIVRAGDAPSALSFGSAARIFTGAPVPLGADTVAMQEDCTAEGEFVTLPQLKVGANLREAGEDVRRSETALCSGTVLDARHVARLASLGVMNVPIRERLRVALFSTGNELGADVRDANGPMIAALSRNLPVDLTFGGVLPDRHSIVREALRKAAGENDLIVTTGGASRGDEDHVLSVLDEIGRRRAWQIAVKPGRPLMFGRLGECAFMGLPGNPVAAFVCFLLYTRPLILRMAGAEWTEPMRYQVPCGFSIRSKPDRREFLRGRIDGNGRLQKYGRDGSGLISGLTASDGLIEIDEETTLIEPGQSLPFLPFSGLA